MEKKTGIMILAVAIGGLLLLGMVCFWPWGPEAGEMYWRMALDSGLKSWQKKAARQLANYATPSSMLALVKVVNVTEKDSPPEEALAAAALESLCILSQEDFGTGFRGKGGGKESADPALGKGWDYTVAEVNYWTMENFGATALSNLGIAPPAPRKAEPARRVPELPDNRSFKVEPRSVPPPSSVRYSSPFTDEKPPRTQRWGEDTGSRFDDWYYYGQGGRHYYYSDPYRNHDDDRRRQRDDYYNHDDDNDDQDQRPEDVYRQSPFYKNYRPYGSDRRDRN